jgi:hypothetical protein
MAGRGPHAHRELDGCYAARAGPQKPPSTRHLIAMWVEEWSVKLRRLGSSFEEIARELTQAGQGKGTLVGGGLSSRPLVELPQGVIFPADYKISARGVLKAFRKALANRVELAANELRIVAHERLETLYLATQGAVVRGDPRAVRAAVAVLREHARIFGYAVPDPVVLEADRKDREREAQEQRFAAALRTLTIEEGELYLDLLDRAEARLVAQTAAKTNAGT